MSTTSMTATAALAAAFGRLFEDEFATLDGITISCRTPAGIRYLDQDDALEVLLYGTQAALMRGAAETDTQALHQALLGAAPEAECAISGWSRHLRALLLEGLDPPPPTSMMRKRGVPDVGAHLVAPDALAGPDLAVSIARARALAEQNGMRHLLLVTPEGMVAVAGRPLNEAVAHWHNIEFASRVECLRLEEAWAEGLREGSDHG